MRYFLLGIFLLLLSPALAVESQDFNGDGIREFYTGLLPDGTLQPLPPFPDRPEWWMSPRSTSPVIVTACSSDTQSITFTLENIENKAWILVGKPDFADAKSIKALIYINGHYVNRGSYRPG
jgi:hypothetical protein